MSNRDPLPDSGASGETVLRRGVVRLERRVYGVDVVEGIGTPRRLLVEPNRLEPATVGTSPLCDLVVSDPQVSRRHFSLEVTAQGLRLVDLASTNGTWLAEHRIGDVFLNGGETLQIGSTRLQLSEVGASGRETLQPLTHFGRVVGSSPRMRRLYPLLQRIAASDAPAVIEGETGTGKELVAEALHEEGPRANGPFVVFDCTTVAPTLIDSALFGHERGAFTGATALRRGVFEQAHGGTLFIDEIGDLAPELQPKLLRAIERKEIQRVGGQGLILVDVRVIAATRRNLDHYAQLGRFRDDLLFRLSVARIHLPALRERQGDVELLANRFWHALGGTGELPSAIRATLLSKDWPGNVRELHNEIARQVMFGDLEIDATAQRFTREPVVEGPERDIDQLEAVLSLDLPFPAAKQRVVESFERRYVERVLAAHGGNVAKAADASGIARRYFQLIRARLKQADV